MNVKIIQQNLWSNLLENKGYFFLSSLLSLAFILLILTPENLWVWGFFGFVLLRLIYLKKRAIVLLACSLAGISAVFTLFHVHSNVTHLEGDVKAAVMEISPADIKVNGNLLSGTGEILLTGNTEKITFFYTLKSEAEKEYWLSLQNPITIQTELTLSTPERARNRHQFDYQAYLFQQKIHWTADLIKIHLAKPQTSFSSKIETYRQKLLGRLQSQLPEGKMREYVMAMLFNQTHHMDEEVMESYRQIGVIHLFSISGMHIQFLLTLLSYLLLRTGVTKETSRPILFFVILFYGLFLGSGVGIFRAVFTNCLLLLAQMGKQRMEVKDAFGVTLLITLWLNPYLVFSLAFQLSYGLSGVLYFVGTAVRRRSLPSWLNPIFLSFLMTAVSFPVLSYHYFEVNWLGMFANIFFSFFFASCFFPAFWAIAILSFLQAPAWIFDTPHAFFERTLQLLEQASEYLAVQKEFQLITGRPAFIFYLTLLVGIFCFLISIEQQRREKTAFLSLVVTFLFFYWLPFLNPTGKVIHLDVGQGDAILFITPFQREVVLLDTGGKVAFSMEESWQARNDKNRHAKNFLSSIKAEGVREMDAVILTHSDQDHIGNFSYLANKMRIHRVFLADGMAETEAWKEKLAEVTDVDFAIESVSAPDRINEGDLSFEVLNPIKEGTGKNEDSLVLFTQIGGHRWLFSGDFDEAGERALVERYPALRVDFLKIGHHGSLTSTSPELLDHLKPKGAFISVGKNNSYGHPDPLVLERLNERRTVVFRTDQQGAIHFLYRRNKQTIETMLQ